MRADMTRSDMMSCWRPGQKILNFWGARQDIKGSRVAWMKQRGIRGVEDSRNPLRFFRATPAITASTGGYW